MRLLRAPHAVRAKKWTKNTFSSLKMSLLTVEEDGLQKCTLAADFWDVFFSQHFQRNDKPYNGVMVAALQKNKAFQLLREKAEPRAKKTHFWHTNNE